jgi:L-fuculose-phosphate aldolase
MKRKAASKSAGKRAQEAEIKRNLAELARVARILAMEGHEDITMGHVSMRDPLGRGFWLKRHALGLAEILDDDFTLVDFEGNAIGGKGPRHSEWPIHGEILRARPDINYVGHTHAQYVALMSCLKEEMRPYTAIALHFAAPPPRFTRTAQLIRSAALGQELAACLGDHQAVLMRNHGCAFVGRTAPELTINGVMLRQACEIHWKVIQTGHDSEWMNEEDSSIRRANVGATKDARLEGFAHFWNYYNRKLDHLEGRKVRHPA